MKLTKTYFLFLLAVLLLPAMSQLLISTTPDTAWTFTLPDDEIVLEGQFSHDDSLVICTIDTYPSDTSYLGVFDSYTGELKRKIKENFNIGHFTNFSVSPTEDYLINFSRYIFNPDSALKGDKNFKIINYKTGEVIDSLVFPSNEPDLKFDTCRVVQFEFAPDGERLFMIVNVTEDYDPRGNPIFREKLFVFDTDDWSLERKAESFFTDDHGKRYFGYTKFLRIAPNNKYYVTYKRNYYKDNNNYRFQDINNDTTLHEITDTEDEDSYDLMFSQDTSKFYIFYYDKIDSINKIKVYNQSDFSLEKIIYNDTLQAPLYNMFAHGSEYLFFVDERRRDYETYFLVYDLENEYIVHKYPIYYYTGDSGPDVYGISSDSEIFFDGWARTLRMYNAKYTTTSAEEPREEPSSMLYPNPANDYIEINIPPLERGSGGVSVFDVLGVVVATSPPASLHSGEGRKVRIDVSSLSPGVYFVRVGGRMYKFVKM